MSQEKRRRFTPEQKVQIIREVLKNHISVSEVCEKYNLSPNVYYRWEKEFFERGVEAFKNNGKNNKVNSKEKRLMEKIKRQQDVIAILTEENIALKKSADGEI
jgi:transposase-like protein